jgi:hypothetical protein
MLLTRTVSLVASTSCSTEKGDSIISILADSRRRRMWSVSRNTAGPCGVAYARMPSKTPEP